MAVRGRYLSLPALPLPDELEQDDGKSEYVAHGGNCEKRFVHRRHLLGGTAHGQPPASGEGRKRNLPIAFSVCQALNGMIPAVESTLRILVC